MPSRPAAVLLVCLVALAAAACSRSETPSTRSALRPVSLPDLSRTDEGVQAQARERHAALMQKVEASGTSDAELASAYGSVGVLLHAAESLDSAEAYYLNAQALAPREIRWPYFLGHLYKARGETDKSIAAFNRALELQPDDVPTLIWLGRLHQELGQPQVAEPLFSKALTQAPRSVAVLAGLGQTALARKDYAAAARHLEQALTIEPQSASIHSPLALAYRGLGEVQKAEEHLKLWRNTDILLADPLKEELDLALESGLSYELRGVRALEARNFQAAAEFFRKGIELAPGTTALGRSLRHKLGTALFLSGDVRGAMSRFDEVVKLAPSEGIDESTAKAYYSLGVLMASSGRGNEAVDRFSSALKYNPSYFEARIGLADALRRAGRFEASLTHYLEAVRINPRAAEARFGYAIALVRLRRYAEARDWLTEGMRVQPDRPELAHALARLLATAPDDRVRDGQRALTLVKQLLEGEKTTQLGETMAMTAAELGNYQEAAAIQRGVIDSARRAGFQHEVNRMAVNLRLYERGQPCRTPWADDDPVHAPGPPVTPGLLDGASGTQ